MDRPVRCACKSHFPCAGDASGDCWILPDTDAKARVSILPCADEFSFTYIALWQWASWPESLTREILETTLCVCADDRQILLCLPLQHGFQHGSEGRLLNAVLFANHNVSTT